LRIFHFSRFPEEDHVPNCIAGVYRLIAALVTANLKHRPVRTGLSILLIAVPVTLILTLVGLSYGFVEDSSQRARGIGADIIVRSPDSAILSFATANMSEKLIGRMEQIPHVRLATGVASHLISGWTTATGIDVAAFERMSGGFTFREGHSFENPDDIVVDTFYARQVHVHAGSRLMLLNRNWNVAGVVEPGKLAHIFLPLEVVQDLDGSRGKVAQIYLKLDDPGNTATVIESLKELLPGYHIYALDELLSLTTADNVPFAGRDHWRGRADRRCRSFAVDVHGGDAAHPGNRDHQVSRRLPAIPAEDCFGGSADSGGGRQHPRYCFQLWQPLAAVQAGAGLLAAGDRSPLVAHRRRHCYGCGGPGCSLSGVACRAPGPN